MVLGSSKSRVKMGGDDPRFWVGMVLGSSKSRVGMGVGHRSRLQVLGGNGLGVIQISCGDGLGAPISSRFWVEMIFGVIQISCGDGCGTPISTPSFGWTLVWDTDLDPRFWVEMVLGASKSRVGMGVGHRSRLQILGGNGLGVIQIWCGDGLGTLQILCGDGLGVIQISCGDGLAACDTVGDLDSKFCVEIEYFLNFGTSNFGPWNFGTNLCTSGFRRSWNFGTLTLEL